MEKQVEIRTENSPSCTLLSNENSEISSQIKESMLFPRLNNLYHIASAHSLQGITKGDFIKVKPDFLFFSF